MDRDPPNPYRDMTLRELHQVMNERAGDLLKGKPVSRRDIAHLLIAAAWPLATGESSIGSPAYSVREGTNVLDAFWPEVDSDIRAVLHHQFEHAREAAHLTWEDVHRYTAIMHERAAPICWPIDTEADFRRSLQQLQDAKDLKARDWIP